MKEIKEGDREGTEGEGRQRDRRKVYTVHVVVEGKQIWCVHPSILLSSFPPVDGLIKIFYNSDFTFSQRLYGTLDVDFPCVRLYQPLSELVQLSTMYTRDSVPYRCFR